MSRTTNPGSHSGTRRAVVYATSRLEGSLDGHIPLALDALRPHADALIVVLHGALDAASRAALDERCDTVIERDGAFDPSVYPRALEQAGVSLDGLDEVLLTGDTWFGPAADLDGVFERMEASEADAWEMVEHGTDLPRVFPEQGFPGSIEPWTWTVVRRAVLTSPAWGAYWAVHRGSGAQRTQEAGFASHIASEGFRTDWAFRAAAFGSEDPAVFQADLLLAAGCPIVKRTVFTLYPPYLHQQAVIGRDIVKAMRASGYPLDGFWQHLSRTVPPKALNTNAGMLEIIGDDVEGSTGTLRIAVVAHISDLEKTEDLLRRLEAVPDGYHLVVTTSDGRKAVAISRAIQRSGAPGAASVDVRVSGSRRGRDMSDFFIACRDVVLSDDFDIIIKVSARTMRRKTVNVRRYFRRFQFENLLASRAHVAGVLALFEREPGLGLVFPPMMHIGYATMGKGWQNYLEPGRRVFDDLGITAPTDAVSPLAPFGGMWIARPRALRLVAEHAWQYRDYGKPGRKRYRDLARLQERIVVAAAAQRGFHARTVLTPEHAAISHTALDFKNDQMFATSYGYPVDAIQLIQRAGKTGYGGIVGLSRMYLRLNHRRLAAVAIPVLDALQWVYERAQALRGNERFIAPRSPWEDDDL